MEFLKSNIVSFIINTGHHLTPLTCFCEQRRHAPRHEQDAADETRLHEQHLSPFANFKYFGYHALFRYTAALVQVRGRLCRWLGHFCACSSPPKSKRHRWPGLWEIGRIWSDAGWGPLHFQRGDRAWGSGVHVRASFSPRCLHALVRDVVLKQPVRISVLLREQRYL